MPLLKTRPDKRRCSKTMRVYVLHHLSQFQFRSPHDVMQRLLNDYGYISERSVTTCLRELEHEGKVIADRSEPQPAFWGYQRHASLVGAL